MDEEVRGNIEYWCVGVNQSQRKKSIISRKLLKEWPRDKHQRRIQILRKCFTFKEGLTEKVIGFDFIPDTTVENSEGSEGSLLLFFIVHGCPSYRCSGL